MPLFNKKNGASLTFPVLIRNKIFLTYLQTPCIICYRYSRLIFWIYKIPERFCIVFELIFCIFNIFIFFLSILEIFRDLANVWDINDTAIFCKVLNNDFYILFCIQFFFWKPDYVYLYHLVFCKETNFFIIFFFIKHDSILIKKWSKYLTIIWVTMFSTTIFIFLKSNWLFPLCWQYNRIYVK